MTISNILKYQRVCRQILSVMVLLLIMNAMACSGDDGSDGGTPASLKDTLKNKTWRLESAKVDGAVTNKYADLTLKFNESTYESGGGYKVFEPMGTWAETEVNKTITFDGELEAEVTVQSQQRITLKFDWEETTYGEGRSKSISGAHEFVMIVQ